MDYVCTMNEPNLAWFLADVGATSRNASDRADPMFRSVAKALGVEPAFLAQFQFAATERAFDVKPLRKAAVDAVHAIHPSPCRLDARGKSLQGGSGGEERAAAAREEICDRFYRASAGDDFVGIQTYSRSWYGADGPVHPPAGVELTQRGEEFYPEAIEESLRAASGSVGTPLFVTENGIASEDDEQRALPRSCCRRCGTLRPRRYPGLGIHLLVRVRQFRVGFRVWPEVRDHLRRSRDATPYREARAPRISGNIARCNGACVEIGDAR